MSEEKFDAIVVGGGLTGSAAAYTLAKAGLETAVVERGTACGAKNVTGGRLYAHSLKRLIPDIAESAPLERHIVKERIFLMTESGATTVEYGDARLQEDACASYSVLRAKLDPWLAERAEEAGAMYVTGIRVDKLLQKNGGVCGVIAGEDVLCADVVLLADGVHSLLAQKLGMKKALAPHHAAVGVKEVIELDEETVSERFGVAPGQGVACLAAGYPTGGAVGGGFLYTNRTGVSLGTVVTLSHIGSGAGVKVPDMIERFKAHPVIAPLIAGGKTVEYAAHLVPEGGRNMMPELFWNGVLLAGDAAGFVINMGYSFRGMDFAIESGRLAAETIIRAKERNDFSADGLSHYRSLLERSFVLRDLRHYQNMPALMDTRQIYDELPAAAAEVLCGLFRVDGSEPQRPSKLIVAAARSLGLTELLKLGAKAWGTL
ncbi:MAG: FAD-dependent oxidoreductase [Clostridiales Family XIII bacterium]|jgi:electron transfer flavoprotein-quinone oxidoreductase|nr:FAD-dependent oxidoreductase [Clostridiales Family XIII bacterium]